MKKTILVFGLISGVLSSLMMVATVPFIDKIGFDKGYYVGYTAIVLSFLLVFFGIRSYRDNVGNGQITFTKGFTVGICITLISCVFYVVTWEILYFTVLHSFMDHMNKYADYVVEKLRASGASAAAIQAKIQEMKKFQELYENPLFNAAMTFIEPFPVGLVITLISAAILRKKAQSHPTQAPLPASS
jgi:hypothetical protein